METITREIAITILNNNNLFENMKPLKTQGQIKHGDYGYANDNKECKRVFLERGGFIQTFCLCDIRRFNLIEKKLEDLDEDEFRSEVYAVDSHFGHDVNLPENRKYYTVCGNLKLIEDK